MKSNYLENIPNDWEIKKLKYISKIQTGRTPNIQGADFDCFENGILDWFTPADFNEMGILSNSKRKINIEAISEIEVFPKKSIYLVSIGATLGKIGIANNEGSANQQINIIVFDNDKVFPKFGYFMLKANKEYIINAADHTTLPILNQNKTKHLSFLIPPLPTQQKIANFLDQKTSEIDTLIKKKKKLIKLLQEEEKAFINEKLTDTEGKWEKKKLKYVAIVQPSNIDKKSKEGEKKVILCNYVDVYKNDFITRDLKFMKATASKSQISKFKVELDDVILTKDSEDPTDIAIPAYVKENIDNLVCGYHLTQVKTIKNILLGSYLFRYLQTPKVESYFTNSANGITRYGVGVDAFKNLQVLFPPLAEQKKNILEIENYIHKNRNTIEKLSKEVDLLKEYRQSLISEAVTGQLEI